MNVLACAQTFLIMSFLSLSGDEIMAVDGIALDGKTLIEVSACKTYSTSPSSFLSIIYPLSHSIALSPSRTRFLPISPRFLPLSPYSHVMSSMSCTFARILLDRGGLPLFFLGNSRVFVPVFVPVSLSLSLSLGRALSLPPSLPLSLSLCVFLCGCVCVCVSPPLSVCLPFSVIGETDVSRERWLYGAA